MVDELSFDIIRPMEPVLIDKPFNDDKYIYQVKWDGIRIVTYISPEGLILRTKKGYLRTETYPELLKIKKIFSGQDAIFDGEVVVLTEQGIPSFNRVLHRDLNRKAGRHIISANPVIYVVFDVIYYNGRFITETPLIERQQLLADIIKPSGDIILCDSYPRGEELFGIMDEKGMEGIVAKERGGLYHVGVKNRTWLKCKCFRKIQAVIGGIALKRGMVSALLLGLRGEGSEGGLDYIGRVSTGLREKHMIQLLGIIKKYEQDQSPFHVPPKPEKDTRNVWLPPYLTAKVQYLEWSDYGVLRNPVLLGFEA